MCAVITTAIIALKWPLFQEVVAEMSNLEPQSIFYLKNISNFSTFLRCVIINWLMSGSTNINQLLLEEKLPAVSSNYHLSSKLPEELQTSVESGLRMGLHDNVASSSNPVPLAKAAQKSKVSKPVSSISETCVDFENIKGHIVGNPNLCFLKKLSQIRLRCTLVNLKILKP